MKATGGVSPAHRDAARIAGWAVGLNGLVTAVGSLLAQHRGASVVAQLLVAEWGVGKLGVAWSDPMAPPPSTRAIARRIGTGGLLGVVGALATLGFATATHAASFHGFTISPHGLATGLLVAGCLAVRDELLLRGLVLRAFHHTLRPWQLLVVVGIVAAAARVGQVDQTPILSLLRSSEGVTSLAVACLSGVCFATLWLRERGAWTACSAHAAWTFVTTTAIGGGLCDLRFAPRAWGGGGTGFDASLAVLSALGALSVAATLVGRRGRPGPDPQPPS
jgi:hypothetical protein